MFTKTPTEKTATLGKDLLKKVFFIDANLSNEQAFAYIEDPSSDNAPYLKIDLTPLGIDDSSYMGDLHRVVRFTLITAENKKTEYAYGQDKEIKQSLILAGFSEAKIRALQMSLNQEQFIVINRWVCDYELHFITAITTIHSDYTINSIDHTYTYNRKIGLQKMLSESLELGTITFRGKIEEGYACCTKVQVPPMLKQTMRTSLMNCQKIFDSQSIIYLKS